MSYDLTPNHVHIWSIDHSELLVLLGKVVEQKNNKDRASCNDIASRYRLASKRFTRQVLSLYVPQSPHTLAIARTCYGKPYLTEFPDLKFSLTHTHQGSALAITQKVEVGLDSEPIPTNVVPLEVAQAVFTDNEYELMKRVSSTTLQEFLFLRSWTAKEACLKALGTGITDDISSLDVSPCLYTNGFCSVQAHNAPSYTLTSVNLFEASVSNLALYSRRARFEVLHYRFSTRSMRT